MRAGGIFALRRCVSPRRPVDNGTCVAKVFDAGATKTATLLIDLFDARGKPEKTAMWRAKLAEYEAKEGSE